jgi:hypothetical protein
MATHLNHLIVDGQLKNFTIIKVKKFFNKVATKVDDAKEKISFFSSFGCLATCAW